MKKWMIKIPETTLVVDGYSQPRLYSLADEGLLQAQVTELPEWEHGQQLLTTDDSTALTFLAPSLDGIMAVVQNGRGDIFTAPWDELEAVTAAALADLALEGGAQ